MTILLLILFVVQGDLDYSYRIQPSLEVCEDRASIAEKHIEQYGRNIQHFETHCIVLKDT